MSSVVNTSMIQGFGFGLIFTPLSIIAFATLPIEFRVDGTAFFSLVRNVGSAIGISVTAVLLTQNTQIIHSQIADNVTPHPPPGIQIVGDCIRPVTAPSETTKPSRMQHDAN